MDIVIIILLAVYIGLFIVSIVLESRATKARGHLADTVVALAEEVARAHRRINLVENDLAEVKEKYRGNHAHPRSLGLAPTKTAKAKAKKEAAK